MILRLFWHHNATLFIAEREAMILNLCNFANIGVGWSMRQQFEFKATFFLGLIRVARFLMTQKNVYRCKFITIENPICYAIVLECWWDPNNLGN